MKFHNLLEDAEKISRNVLGDEELTVHEDLLIHILSFLSPRQLSVASSVSRQWYDAARSPEVWKRKASSTLLKISKLEALDRSALCHCNKILPSSERQIMCYNEICHATLMLTAVLQRNFLRNPSFLERVNRFNNDASWVRKLAQQYL